MEVGVGRKCAGDSVGNVDGVASYRVCLSFFSAPDKGNWRLLCSCAYINTETTINLKRAELSCSALLRVEGELLSMGEHDMSLRHVEPMLFTLMQQLMNALGVVNGETGCLEEVERWKDRDL